MILCSEVDDFLTIRSLLASVPADFVVLRQIAAVVHALLWGFPYLCWSAHENNVVLEMNA
ncbi:hypothetical protein Tsubulata_022773 [Turnera subulata]|uniref:Uncharacterized protein n=1 Tax=Turnera subulata TaxID=218843 RepID=A0A9Q0J1R3_9ROSI|nr:hypothetical protein Tsubulata_022773 [Turnera subulata]